MRKLLCGGVYYREQDAISARKRERGPVLARQAYLLLRLNDSQVRGIPRTDEAFIHGLAYVPGGLLDVSEVDEVSVAAQQILTHNLHRHGVVMSVQLLPEALERYEVRAIELEVCLTHVHFELTHFNYNQSINQFENRVT